VLLHVSDGRLVKVEGDRESPLNHGRLCPIGTVTLDLVYHPDRLKYPMRRLGARGSGKMGADLVGSGSRRDFSAASCNP
jgi:anaerobic selenocysteine-containing dehydrogenase